MMQHRQRVDHSSSSWENIDIGGGHQYLRNFRDKVASSLRWRLL